MTQPRLFKKKPVVVEAMRFSAYTMASQPAPWNDNEGGELWQWLHSHGQQVHLFQDEGDPAYALIPTLEGQMEASVGDWVIRGVAGEFYPCKPDIFAATYEPVESPSTPEGHNPISSGGELQANYTVNAMANR